MVRPWQDCEVCEVCVALKVFEVWGQIANYIYIYLDIRTHRLYNAN